MRRGPIKFVEWHPWEPMRWLSLRTLGVNLQGLTGEVALLLAWA